MVCQARVDQPVARVTVDPMDNTTIVTSGPHLLKMFLARLDFLGPLRPFSPLPLSYPLHSRSPMTLGRAFPSLPQSLNKPLATTALGWRVPCSPQHASPCDAPLPPSISLTMAMVEIAPIAEISTN